MRISSDSFLSFFALLLLLPLPLLMLSAVPSAVAFAPTVTFTLRATVPARAAKNHHHQHHHHLSGSQHCCQYRSKRSLARFRSSLWPLHNDANSSLDGGGGSGGGGGGDGSSFDIDLARKQLQSLFTEEGVSNSDDPDGTAYKGDSAASSSNANNINNIANVKFNIRTFLSQAAEFEVKRQAGEPVPLEDSLLPPLPPLSTIERDRREAEIQIMEKLAKQQHGDKDSDNDNDNDNDDAVKELWNLWYSERGGLALARLQQADQLMGDPTSWQDCETSLLQLIDEYTIYFVEPVNRLATLYYLQGKYEEAYHLCRLILLKLKPWHVGALAGMVQVCIHRGDREEARYWATKRLPSSVAGSSFPPFDKSNGPENPRRAEWVQVMVKTAGEMLQQAEQNTKKSFFGKPEEYYKKKENGRASSKEQQDDDDGTSSSSSSSLSSSWEEESKGDDAWQ